MDTFHIITQEGYRREDLKKYQQEELKAQDFLIEQLDNLKGNLDFIGEGYDVEFCEKPTIIDKIKNEIATEVIDKAIQWLRMNQAEYQIALAEEQE